MTVWKKATCNSRTIKQAWLQPQEDWRKHHHPKSNVRFLQLPPTPQKTQSLFFLQDKEYQGQQPLSCFDEAAWSPQHSEWRSIQWKEVEGISCKTARLLQRFLLQQRSGFKTLPSLHLTPLLLLCRTVPKPCIALDRAAPSSSLWNWS